MIEYKDNVFYLTTKDTSYWFGITEFKHLEHFHYGPRLNIMNPESIRMKHSAETGGTVAYDESDPTYSLDAICLEYSGIGTGDYRHSPIEIKMPDTTFVSDFVYKSHRIFTGHMEMKTLPSAYGKDTECKTLEITLEDESNSVEMLMYYTVYEESNVITRRAVLKNNNEKSLVIRRIMSMMLDMPNRDFHMVTFDGGWIKEAHKHIRKIESGLYVNSSTTGASSNKHNPGFLLAEKKTDEDAGNVYGFNIIYSGNHYGAVELSSQDIVRVMMGINPHCFEWVLKKDEFFETPEVIMTFSENGYNKLSRNFHDFVNNNVVRGDWKNKERPVVINNWEATFFRFNERKLSGLARRAKRLGVEMFVLDDGWFGKRNDDTAGLGDYSINKKNLPRGLSPFIKKVNKMGLKFGLWFEPEMVNPDSDLFRAHPEYAVTTPGKKPTLGRHQLVLDLCNSDVRDYIVENVCRILDSNEISYVKWDMNRHVSDAYSALIDEQGEFFHRYIMGLYDILERIFIPRPHILLESCSSGGNRFDLGMLCYSPQIWTSDDTDPIERLKIQGGLSYLYPQSSMGAHVSSAPHQQTLRHTPMSTRFNVASFGCLGYEFDLKHLNFVERREIKNQIAVYKKHRNTFQYGDFTRTESNKDNKVIWQSVSKDKSKAAVGFYQTLCNAAEGYDYLPVKGLEKDSKYSVETLPQSIFVKTFGDLVKFLLPFSIDPEGFLIRTANKFYALTNCVEKYEACGKALEWGIKLNNQFMGTNYNENTRLLSDYGSNLYIVNKI
ncbi:MAG: alpha-galactosidase [Clostridia bacterium]|nr:alpha-galactosidase [Clostridia bacterium]